VNPILLYLLFVKAALTSFSGMGGIPIVREELVVQRRVVTDRQLSTAVAVGRAVPGPNGLYLVATGYFVAGIPGAAAGCAALMTPAFLVIPLLMGLGRHRDHPRVRGAIRAVTLAAAGLVLSATIPMARDAWTSALPIAISLASFAILTWTEADTLWVVLLGAASGLAGIGLL